MLNTHIPAEAETREIDRMHDSVIAEYRVHLQNETIEMVSYGEQTKYTLKMTGVLTHSFENIQSSNIVLSVEQKPVERFLADNQALLLRNQKDAWPVHFDSLPELERFLKEEAYQYLVIYASLGLCGWVLAKNFTLEEEPWEEK